MSLLYTMLNLEEFQTLKSSIFCLQVIAAQSKVSPIKWLNENFDTWGLSERILELVRKHVYLVTRYAPLANDEQVSALLYDEDPYIRKCSHLIFKELGLLKDNAIYMLYR